MARFVQARHFTPGRIKPLRVVVWHDMEAPEKTTTAEAVANYFHGSNAPQASAHVCADQDSVVECVKPGDTAWHAPGANADGYGIELAGYARQSAAEWRDASSKATIRNAARWVAPIMEAHGIPAKWLTDAELADGHTKGMTTHRQVSRVFRLSDHTDPGPNFPEDFALAEVQDALGTPIAPAHHGGGKSAPVPAKKPAKAKPAHAKRDVLGRGDSGDDVRAIQVLMNSKGLARLAADGDFGPATEAAVKHAQSVVGVSVDGVWGPHTQAAVEGYRKAPEPMIRRGARGPWVSRLQSLLQGKGYTLRVDGDFGPATEARVRDFQTRHGLVSDGVVGPKTWAALT